MWLKTGSQWLKASRVASIASSLKLLELNPKMKFELWFKLAQSKTLRFNSSSLQRSFYEPITGVEVENDFSPDLLKLDGHPSLCQMHWRRNTTLSRLSCNLWMDYVGGIAFASLPLLSHLCLALTQGFGLRHSLANLNFNYWIRKAMIQSFLIWDHPSWFLSWS